MKFSSRNCRTRSCNGNFTESLFPRRLYLPKVDCSDRSLAIDDGTGLSCKLVADAILAEQEEELPVDHHTFFSPLVFVSHVTETDNLHTQVTQHKYTSSTTHKQSKQTENNQNCETLGLFIFLSAETKRTNSYIICSYQQQVILNNSLFIKLGVRIKTFPANSH